ncbi:MAG: D-tyrosyl-tRNA(Tyr) deacylase [Clostridiales bacterium]|jgi:D-tyrosyl-tRNA(Tyr) deacylase|nr:D-tyrosyl-tRNA(Tyr) deacylase [Clostridiales bacterium]
MRAVVQRVTSSKVEVDGKIVGAIEKGFLVLLGVMDEDTKEDAALLARKVASLRVFEDENGKMNLELSEINGSVLAVSQFTLCADVKKGNRPSFSPSASPEKAEELYEFFCGELKINGISTVEKGVFGADMSVSLINDGPVTIIYDTNIWRK